MLHITNGDSAAGLIRQVVDGEVSIWADVLHDGPVPAVDDETFRRTRAAYHAANGEATFDDVLATLRSWDAAIDTAPQHDAVILWFEHDLFDQLILVRTLRRLSRLTFDGRLRLICIGEFPGIERFHGLGQLNAAQMSTLVGKDKPVTTSQCDVAWLAWSAFTSDDPSGLVALLDYDLSALTFLADAIRRQLAEFPSTRDGLPETERGILHTLEIAPRSPGELFQAVGNLEARPYMGDASFYLRLRELAGGERPLVRIENSRASITEDGCAVLAGRADAIEMRGFDRWIGGTHLTPGNVWRWDGERLVLS